MDPTPGMATARIEAQTEGESRVLRATGRLDTEAAARLWPTAMKAAEGAPIVALDLAGLEAIDSAGAVMLLTAAPDAELRGAPDHAVALLERTRKALGTIPPPGPPAPWHPITAIGRATVNRGRDTVAGIAFIGEAVVTTLRVLTRPRLLRLADVLRHLDEVGTRAFPLTLLLGFLIGVILAYQSSIPLRRFGAEVFVPNLVGISLLRELGPLLAGVVLAGRTGSAFAAELGTMTVNEEVDALKIMGVDATAMLVLPRLVAATIAMPVLALLMNVAGLAGMTLIMGTLGYPWASVQSQLQQWLSLQDLAGGLFKAACFGLVIAGIGCRAGLSAGRGPRAVGDAATAAVVGGIVAIVVMDGVFAVLFFRLGI
ncbi:STAS domain-containing protein [Roseomonas terrae]|jgi:phospholipid/cholesterol/gamma-HCH transport system permease protein|uniref:STAS domain-containing protein n=1 Tax=Neoroseomonas terrae TaxID=424799 RepID=A0ABS5EAJ9_9PROT|nr:ABC transporter permease [Neoroseomonas terrae]MBR0648046.1 STAS domain-containing protein [Neoroseomonas terrae]